MNVKAAGAADDAVKVLDSWAVLAWLRNEPAGAAMDRLLAMARAGRLRLAISAINLGEAFYIVARWRSEKDAELFLSEFQTLPVDIRSVPKALVFEAARLKGTHRLSYADAFAVATAVREKAVLVTGDPEMKALESQGIVKLVWIRS